MSISNFIIGERVTILADYNQFKAQDGNIYHIACVNSIQGVKMAQLLQDGRSVGALPESNLKSAK